MGDDRIHAIKSKIGVECPTPDLCDRHWMLARIAALERERDDLQSQLDDVDAVIASELTSLDAFHAICKKRVDGIHRAALKGG